MGVDEQTARSFLEHHCAHPQVYYAFQKAALEAIGTRTRVGAKAIFEDLRFETQVGTSDDEFKLNNVWASYYARLFALRNPEHSTYFEFRRTKGLRAAA
jgi:hypothetical protein